MSEFQVVLVQFDEYRRVAHSIAAMHGIHADSVSIPEDRDAHTLYYGVLKFCDCGCDTSAPYAVFSLRQNAAGGSMDFGGFTALPGYGREVLSYTIGHVSRVFTRLTLDCFDKGDFLPSLYRSVGFEEYARESYDTTVYPPLADGSTPDVVYMRRFV